MERDLELIREWGHISENDQVLIYNSFLFDELKSLGRMAKKHKVLCENLCNLPNFDQDKIKKQEEKIINKINIINNWFKISFERQQLKTFNCLKVEFQQDPRGLTTKIYILGEKDKQGVLLFYSLGLKD